MNDIFIPICVAAVGSSALFGFFQFLINRRDRKGNLAAELSQTLNELRKNNSEQRLTLAKIELMLLISTYPDKTGDILDRAKTYFVDLGGDTYITGLFDEWMNNKKIDSPMWYIEREHK